jgi:hypothetical protein
MNQPIKVQIRAEGGGLIKSFGVSGPNEKGEVFFNGLPEGTLVLDVRRIGPDEVIAKTH